MFRLFRETAIQTYDYLMFVVVLVSESAVSGFRRLHSDILCPRVLSNVEWTLTLHAWQKWLSLSERLDGETKCDLANDKRQ